MTSQILLLASSSIFILLLHFFQPSLANCPPSACGVIRNISHPFRLKHDHKHCGDPRFELACENDVASLSLNSHKYYVKEINYLNSTMRLVDASINNDTCSFPNSSAYRNNFTYPHFNSNFYLYDILGWPINDLNINLMSCPNPLKNSSLFTNMTYCASSSSSSSHPRYTYVKVGHMNASEVPETCRIDVIVMTSWEFKDSNNVSLSEIHHSLLYGFQLGFCHWCKPIPKWGRSFIFLLVLIVVKFTKKRRAGAQDASQESKRLKSASPVHEQQLVRTDPAATDLRPPTSSPPSQKKTTAIVISGGGEGMSGSPTRLEGLSLTEGVGQFVKWLEQESVKQEDEKSRYSEQLTAARVKLGRANTEVKALKADLAAQRARAAEEAEEAGRLRAELKAAKGELRTAKDGQGEVLRAYTKRLLLSDQFTELARDLAGLINGNTALEAIEEVAKDYPGLDASKYGYQRLEGAAVYTQYAEVVRRHLGRLPLLNELASLSAFLTAEVVAACPADRDADLDAAFDALPEGDVEMEEAGAEAEDERTDEEPSGSKVVENPTSAEAGGAAEGTSAGKPPTPEKEVGEA